MNQTPSAVVLRDADELDLQQALELNQSALPHVGSIDLPTITRLKSIAHYFKVASLDGSVAGFVIAMTPHADYASPNFRWFKSHYDDFLYIDRIVVADTHRGAGVGRALYEDAEREARAHGCLTCEVNLEPPNPESLAFHQAMGFESVGEQQTESIGDSYGKKTVCFLLKRCA